MLYNDLFSEKLSKLRQRDQRKLLMQMSMKAAVFPLIFMSGFPVYNDIM